MKTRVSRHPEFVRQLNKPDSLRSNEPEPPAGLKPERGQMVEFYAFFDKKVGSYKPPFPVKHAEFVLRGIQDMVREGTSDVVKYPADFAIYHISTFDDVEGKFITQKPTHFAEVAALMGVKPAPDGKFYAVKED